MPREGKVAIYLSPKVKKMVAIEAIKRETTIGDFVGEAVLAWFKFLKKMELEDRVLRNELSEIESLKAEQAYIQTELDLLLKIREEKKQRRKA